MSKLSHVTVLKHYLNFRYRRFFLRKDLENYQVKKLDFLFKHTLKKSIYYNNILQHLESICSSPQEILQKLPILSKKEYLENFDTINTCRIKYNDALTLAKQAEENKTFDATYHDISIGLSSGTSGVRGLFLVNKNEKSLWAALALARVLRASVFENQRIALILRANSDLYESTKSKKIQFRYFGLTCPFSDLYSQIKEFNPTILLGPASCLENIAKEEENLHFSDRLQPRQIIACAEILYSDVRDVLEKTWQLKIDQIYQATEGFLAFTCPYGNLHFNEDCLYIEKEYIQNNDNKRYFYPILTDFFRTSQPMIRYKLNDILEDGDQDCPCGCPFSTIKNILGREEDLLSIQQEKIFPNKFLDILQSIKRTTQNRFSDFQIIAHENEDILRICLQKRSLIDNEDLEQKIRKEFVNFFEEKRIRPPMIEFAPLTECKPWIKRRRIIKNNVLNTLT